MRKTIAAISLFVWLNLNALAQTPARLVNPFIGTAPNPFTHEGYPWDTGNVFPGAVCPRGMVEWSPDTTHQNQIAGGYWYPDHVIQEFSLTHFSGRGVPCLKDIPFMPVLGEVTNSPGTNWTQFAATFAHTNETASPGYYRVRFDNGIQTELTATPRTGMARFTFPAQTNAALLIRADTAVFLQNRKVMGFRMGKIGGADRSYEAFFYAEFDRPFSSARTWSADTITGQPAANDPHCGAILAFDTTTNPVVQARVGLSSVTYENAADNLAAENPGWDFEAVRQKAEEAWNKALGCVEVEGGTEAQQQTFYTALYHCFMQPNLLDDVNGQYRGMDGKVHKAAKGHHQYQGIPAWDQWRSYAPLMAILTPGESSDIDQSLVNYAKQDAAGGPKGGGLPRWQQVNRNSGGMVGDGDDAIIASSYALGATNFDTGAALAAMEKGASVPGTTSDDFAVRGGLKDYLGLGYVPHEVSVTLEYCNADFALAEFAKALGDTNGFATYRSHADNWTNLFDETTRLLRPRDAAGNWMENFDGRAHQGFVEGTAAQYVWMVNFDLPSLVHKMGGNEQTTARLDQFFQKLNSGPKADTAYMGNEPCEETPWVYDFVNEPALAQKTVRRIQNELFTNLPNGLPGNDDEGALSSWYVFSALGLYPEIPGVGGFVVGSPLFARAVIHRGNGADIQIIGEHAATENPYVQSLTLNGKDHNKGWIWWSDLANGATLDFVLDPAPSSWAVRPKAPLLDVTD